MHTPYPEEEQPSSSLATVASPDNKPFHDDVDEKSRNDSEDLSAPDDLDDSEDLSAPNDLQAPNAPSELDDLDAPDNPDDLNDLEDGEVFYYDLEDMEEPEGIQGSERFYDAMDLECMEDLQDYLVDLERIFLDARIQPGLQDIIRQMQIPPSLLSSYPAIQAFTFFLEKISSYYWIPSSLFKTYLESPHDSSLASNRDWDFSITPAKEEVQEYLPIGDIPFDDFPPLGDLLLIEQILPPPPSRSSHPKSQPRWTNHLLAAQANLKRDLSIYQAQVEQLLSIFDPTLVLLHSEFAHATLEEEIKNLEALYNRNPSHSGRSGSTWSFRGTKAGSPTSDPASLRANMADSTSDSPEQDAFLAKLRQLPKIWKSWFMKEASSDEPAAPDAPDNATEFGTSDYPDNATEPATSDFPAGPTGSTTLDYPAGPDERSAVSPDQAQRPNRVPISDAEFACLSFWCRVLLPQAPSRQEIEQLKDNYFRPSASLAAKSFDDKRKEYQSAYQMLTVHMTEHHLPQKSKVSEAKKHVITKDELERLVAKNKESNLLAFLKSRLEVLNNLLTTMNQMAYGTKRDEVYGSIFSTVWKGIETNPQVLRIALLEAVDICTSCEELAYFLVAPAATLEAFAHSQSKKLPQLPPSSKESADALCRRLLEAVPHLLLSRQILEGWTLPSQALTHVTQLYACNIKTSQVFWDRLCHSFLSPTAANQDAELIWEEDTSMPYAYQEITKNTSNSLILRLRSVHDTLFQIFPDKHKLWASQVNLPLDLGKYSLDAATKPRNHQLTFLDHYGKAVILTHLAILLVQKNPPILSEYLSPLERKYFKERAFEPFEDVPLDDPDFLFMLNREKTEMRPGHRLALAQFFKLAGQGAKGVFEEAFAATIQRTSDWLALYHADLAALSRDPRGLADLFAQAKLEAGSTQDEDRIKALQTYWEAKSLLRFLRKQSQQEEKKLTNPPISKKNQANKAPILNYMGYVPEFSPAPYYPFEGLDLPWTAEDFAYLLSEYPSWVSAAFTKEHKIQTQAYPPLDGLDRKEDGTSSGQVIRLPMTKKQPLGSSHDSESMTALLGPLASLLYEANALYDSSQLTLNRYIYNYIDNPLRGQGTLSPDDVALFFPFQPQEEAKRIRQGLQTYTGAFTRMVNALYFDYPKIRQHQPDLIPLPHYEFYQLMKLGKTRLVTTIRILEDLYARHPELNEAVWIEIIQRFIEQEIKKAYELISCASFYNQHIYHILSYSIDAFTATWPSIPETLEDPGSPDSPQTPFRWHPTHEAMEIRQAIVNTLTEAGEHADMPSHAPQDPVCSPQEMLEHQAQALKERQIFLTQQYPQLTTDLLALLRLILKQLNLTDFWFSNTEYKLDQSVMDKAKIEAAASEANIANPATATSPLDDHIPMDSYFESQCTMSQEGIQKDIQETIFLLIEEVSGQISLESDKGRQQRLRETKRIQALLLMTEKDLQKLQKRHGQKATYPVDQTLSLVAFFYREYFGKKVARMPYEAWTWKNSQVLRRWQPQALSTTELVGSFQENILPALLTELLTAEAPIYEHYMKVILQQEMQEYLKVQKLDRTQQRACLSLLNHLPTAYLLAELPYVAIPESPHQLLAWARARQLGLSQAEWLQLREGTKASKGAKASKLTTASKGATASQAKEKVLILPYDMDLAGFVAFRVPAASLLTSSSTLPARSSSAYSSTKASNRAYKTADPAKKQRRRNPDDIPKMEYLSAMLYYTRSVLMEKIGDQPQKWPSLEELFTNQLLKTETLRPVVKDFAIKGMANSKQNAKDCLIFIQSWEWLREDYLDQP